MLDKEDIQKIKDMLKDTVADVLNGVGEVFEENVMPTIDEIAGDVDLLKKEMKEVKRKLTTMPDRDEVVRIVNEATGSIVAKVRNEDKKVNTHIDFAKENGNLSDPQYQELKKIEVFPRVRQ